MYGSFCVYEKKLEHSSLDPCRVNRKTERVSDTEQTLFRSIVGKINWAVQGSRPDLGFHLINLSTKLKEASVGDLTQAIKVIGKLKDIRPKLLFPGLLGNISDDWEIFVFCDAALGNLNNGEGSVGAHIIWIKDRKGNCCPIFWQSKKIKRVVRSTIAAEALSLIEGLESAIYYREIVEEMCSLKQCLPITAFIDNRSVIEAISSTKMVDDKRLRIDIAGIGEMKRNSNIFVKWCPGKVQLAKSLSKNGASGIELLNILQEGKMPE